MQSALLKMKIILWNACIHGHASYVLAHNYTEKLPGDTLSLRSTWLTACLHKDTQCCSALALAKSRSSLFTIHMKRNKWNPDVCKQ